MSDIAVRPQEWMEKISGLREHIGKVIVGQRMLWSKCSGIFAGGHALLEGIPGLGKTMLVRTVSEALSCLFPHTVHAGFDAERYNGYQYPVVRAKHGDTGMTFQKGPLFSIVLADEINRATPKTQSALLEAMQEKTVTVGGVTHQLPKPSSFLPRKTRWKTRERIHCRRRSLTAFC